MFADAVESQSRVNHVGPKVPRNLNLLPRHFGKVFQEYVQVRSAIRIRRQRLVSPLVGGLPVPPTEGESSRSRLGGWVGLSMLFPRILRRNGLGRAFKSSRNRSLMGGKGVAKCAERFVINLHYGIPRIPEKSSTVLAKKFATQLAREEERGGGGGRKTLSSLRRLGFVHSKSSH